jgi:DNA (cytosine-5)-methyltransferase 1
MPPKVVSLFTGPGGLDLGLEAAGFETAVAIEYDHDSAETIRANRQWSVIERDIHHVPSTEILSVAGVQEGEVDLLAGGPPCQPFSKSGYWARGDALRMADPRAATLKAYLRVLHDIKPKVFLLENVPGLAFREKDEGVKLFESTIESINREVGTQYAISIKLLNAVEYGIPQERLRVFIVGSREGAEFKFPARSHSRGIDSAIEKDGSPLPSCFTAWDAIGDLEDDDNPSLELRGKWADLLPSIPEGSNYLYHTARGGGLPLFGWRRRYWSFLLKLAKDQPSWTITSQPGSAIGPFHWKNRRLSARELCRLQTFPEGYKVHGSLSSIQRQIGNAVPSALAEVLGMEIRKQLLGADVSSERALLPTRRGRIPGPEPVRRVPSKYLHLVGEHEPHPGTGKGYGALARQVEKN